jgi:dolichyl-phosphate-mannose-protein mannosyltransferase
MSSSSLRSDTGAGREALVVAALTTVGGLLRLWSIGRLGLVHFDEGIYAMAGTWVLSPRGLSDLDPTVISYAPPGFPFLVGLSYALLGVSDLAAIGVSIATGTLTIPVIGWLAYRTFGRGAGAAAAAFAALSGSHIAFSRMALTDVSFGLFWIIAIAQGQRFLERPGPIRAATLGVAVGAAQLFKYNGWMAGAVVAATAIIEPLVRPDHRSARRQLDVSGWGLLAAMIAAAVYWPWFRFVEVHGGYAALLAHQRGYLGGISSWPGQALALALQDDALSGGVLWLATGAFVAALCLQFTDDSKPDGFRTWARSILALVGFTTLCAYPGSNWFGSLFWLSVLVPIVARLLDTKAHLFLVVAWVVMALMTPFYHPYARLLMPLHTLSWVLMGGAFAHIRKRLDVASRKSGWTLLGMPRPWVQFTLVSGLVPIVMIALGLNFLREMRLGPLLLPSDSLREACRNIASDLPKDLVSLRLYARPPFTFYLAGSAPVAPQPTMERLFETGNEKTLALLDAAMIRQERGGRGRLTGSTDRWDLVREVPTTLNLPTLLDIDPSAATARSPDRAASLMLFRPRRSGAQR